MAISPQMRDPEQLEEIPVAGRGLALAALEAREQQARGGARQAVGNQELVS